MNREELMNRGESIKLRTVSQLAKAKNPEQLDKILSSLYAEHSEVVKEVLISESITLACSEGCYYCCYIKVDARAQEVISISRWLRKTLTPKAMTDLVARCDAHRRRIGNLTEEQQFGSINPCPLLVENRCSIYKNRPFMCRNYHAQKLQPCMDAFSNPENLDAPHTQHNALLAFGGMVVLSSNAGYADRGYDQRVSLRLGICFV